MKKEEVVIKVNNLSKRYRIGLAEERQETFALQIWHMLTAPLRNFNNLRSLSKFDKNKEDESIFWALKDINFEVGKGEVLGIIGHNGAGKSTLLKILSRITDPTEGEIEIKGRVSSLLEVGTGFHADLTGRENVYMNGTILGMSKKEIDKKFNEIAAFSGIGKYIDTPVKRYSSGMKVRLAFSVAAHLDPEILIIDEVLAVGDAEFQRKCLGKMEDVAGQGRTVLFVSHNMTAVNSLCSRAIELFSGKLVLDSNTNDVIEHYLNKSRNAKGIVENYSNDNLKLIIKNVSIESNSENIYMKDMIKVIIKYKNYDISKKIDFTLQLKDSIGNYIFSTSSLYETLSFIEEGEIKCEIPGNFLNQGFFSLNLLVIENGKKLLRRYDDVINFNILPPKEKIGNWMGKSVGPLKPKLRWQL